MNKLNIVNHLTELSQFYLKLEDTIRASSFSRAAHAISELDLDIIENINQLNGIKGVGKSTKEVVDEFMKTNTSSRFETLKKKLQNESNSNEATEKASNILKKFKIKLNKDVES